MPRFSVCIVLGVKRSTLSGGGYAFRHVRTSGAIISSPYSSLLCFSLNSSDPPPPPLCFDQRRNSKRAVAGRDLQNIRISLYKCSEAGSFFPNLPVFLLEHHPVACSIKQLQGPKLQEGARRGIPNLKGGGERENMRNQRQYLKSWILEKEISLSRNKRWWELLNFSPLCSSQWSEGIITCYRQAHTTKMLAFSRTDASGGEDVGWKIMDQRVECVIFFSIFSLSRGKNSKVSFMHFFQDTRLGRLMCWNEHALCKTFPQASSASLPSVWLCSGPLPFRPQAVIVFVLEIYWDTGTDLWWQCE